MKKIGLLVAFMLMLVMLVFSAYASETTGQCGDKVYWSFNEGSGELIISGSGEMYDYDYYAHNRPWESFINNIKTVVEEGVTTIGEDAFYDSCKKLTSVKLSDTITTIGNCAFYLCTELDNITIPDSVTSIGDNAFTFCHNLEKIELSANVKHIGSSPFSGCRNLKAIIVHSNNEYFSNDENGVLFDKDKTKLIQYPRGNTKTIYVIPETVKSIGSYAFESSNNLEKVTLPNGVEDFGVEVFWCCEKLTNITIPNSVTEIERGMFYHCKNLTNITIPDSVTSIYSNAFNGCEKLEDVYYSGTKEQWGNITISSGNDYLTNATIHYHYNNHSYNEAVSNPTCTEQGYTTYTCECGDAYIANYVNATGHDMGNWENDVDSSIAVRQCKNCDFIETKEIEPEEPQEDTSINFNSFFKLIEALINFFTMLANLLQ